MRAILSRFPLRVRLLAPAMLGAVALAACSDRQPSAPDSSTLLNVSTAATTTVSVVVRGGQKCPTEGTTASAFDPVTGQSWHSEVLNSTATFSLPGGAKYLFFWGKIPYANIKQQLDANRGLLYAPFDVPEAQQTPNAAAPNCGAVVYDPSLGNNSDLKTVDVVNARLDNPNSASQVLVSGSSLTLKPITLGGTPDAKFVGELLDANGNPVTLSAPRNLFRIQPATGTLAGICSAPADASPTDKAWFCALQRGILDEQAHTSGSFDFNGNPGTWVIELKDGKKTYLKAVRGTSGQTTNTKLVQTDQVLYSYYFSGMPNTAAPSIPLARAGWTVDGANLATRVIQVMVNGEGTGRFTVSVTENPGQKGSSATTYVVDCGTGTAATSCIQVTPKGKSSTTGVWTAGANADGTLTINHTGGANTTTACVKVTTSTDTAPATPDTGCTASGGGVFMEKSKGTGGTFASPF